MCGRFAFFANGQFGYESLQLPEPPPFERYNIAPSQEILAIRTDLETGRPEWALLRWGLRHSGSRNPWANVRSSMPEPRGSNQTFLIGPIRHRRCIVPASGFYEAQGTGKQPYFVRPAAAEVFALAGIWDHWEGKKERSSSPWPLPPRRTN